MGQQVDDLLIFVTMDGVEKYVGNSGELCFERRLRKHPFK
jgi:hypothetical protein